MTKQDDSYEIGLKRRQHMFGEEGTNRAIEQASEFGRPLQDIVTRWCFGEVWDRPHLDQRTRSLLTLAIVVALGRQNQFRVHVTGALNNGVTRDEIREVLLHTMLYAGIPAAVDGFSTAEQIFNEMDGKP